MDEITKGIFWGEQLAIPIDTGNLVTLFLENLSSSSQTIENQLPLLTESRKNMTYKYQRQKGAGCGQA